MRFLLEAMAFAQLAFLPGILALRLCGFRFGFFGTPVACLALSGLFNYLFVLLATACGCLNHAVAILLFAVEALLAVWLWRDALHRDLGKALAEGLEKLKASFSDFMDACDSKTFAALTLLAAAFAIFLAIATFVNLTGGIFDAWDAVLSWNRWATGWLAGSYPEWTNGYPQLVPTNWAMAYMIQGDTLQFVPKMTVGLYEIGVMLALVDIALLLRSAGVMAAVPLFAWLVRNVEIARFGGDVDLAVTFMAFATFHCVMRASKAETAGSFKQLVILASVLAAATAATKQAGLFIFVMILPLGYLLLRDQMKRFDLGVSYRLKSLGTHLGLALLIAAPCYICAKYMVMQGRDKYKVHFVTEGIYAGRGYGERAIISSKMFLLRLGLGMHEIPGARWTHVKMNEGLTGIVDFYKPYRGLTALTAAFAILLFALAAFSPVGRWALLFMALPFTVVWALLYCYDLRNLCSAIPFLALGLGLGLERLVKICGRCKIPAWSVVVGVVGIVAALGAFLLDSETIAKSHETLEMRIGDPRINSKIYAYQEKNPITGRIATDYEFVDYLPGMKGSLCYQEFSGKGEKEFRLYRRALYDTTVNYLLVPGYTMKRIVDDIKAQQDAGALEFIFSDYNYTFYKIKTRPEGQPPEKVED